MHQITVNLTSEQMETLIANLDGLIYSLGFDHDENLIELYNNLVDLNDDFHKPHDIQ